MAMDLKSLHPAPGSRKASRRLGRGHGSGRGKTAGKGTKGQKARAGARIPGYFEGGQNSMVHRMPVKRGLHNKQPQRQRPAIVNISDLEQFSAGEVVTRDDLITANLVEARIRVIKILGNGELTHALTVVADEFSAGAKAKIEAAGGQAVVAGATATEGS